MGILLFLNRKKLDLQRVISLPKFLGNLPIVYAVLLRAKIGIGLMDKWSSKYREQIKLFGLCSIGIGFLGMLFAFLSLIMSLWLILFKPEMKNTGGALLLPFTTIPGFGYLSFWHFLISIFVILVIHEFAHGLVAKAHNIPVKSTGVGALCVGIPIIPVAFVEPDDEKLKKQGDVVQYSVFAAGPGINLVFALFIYLIFLFAFVPIENNMVEQTGFSYDMLNESYPASIAGMVPGTINSVNGKEINNYWDFYNVIQCINPGDTITIGTIAANYSFATTTHPDDETKAFIGIKPIENQVRIKDEYKKYGPIFGWLKGLIQWLYRLNFFIGIFNLLPLGIVDGGRMFQIALQKIVPNKKKGNKIFVYITILLTVIILLALWKTYGDLIMSGILSLFR